MTRTAIILVCTFLVLGAGCQRQTVERQYDPFETSREKVQIDVTLTGETRAGTALAVLIDEQCLTAKPRSELTRSVTPTFGADSRSHVQTHKVTLAKTMTVAKLKRLANEDSCVKGIGNFRKFHVDQNEPDPLLAKQSHLGGLKGTSFLNVFFNPKSGIKNDVVVAIIDTGIDLSHPDLKNSLWVNPTELSGAAGFDDDKNGFVDDIHGYNFPSHTGNPSHEMVNDHGTHVAGLLGAVSGNGEGGMGVMGRHIRIMALNVFGKNWNAGIDDVDRAIRYAVDNGAAIINISVGGAGAAPTTAAAIAYALNRGSIVVVSAGNGSRNITENFYFLASYSTAYWGMLSVGAIDSISERLCDFSSYSPVDVEILAPGCDSSAPKAGLISTISSGRYGYRKGTSMSAPLVAGAIALTFGLLRDRSRAPPSPTQVEEIFLKACRKNSQLEAYAVSGCVLDLNRLAEQLN